MFLIQIPIISAQEDTVDVPNPLRVAEQAFTISESAADTGPAAGPSVWSVVRMVLTLALVAVAIYGVVILIRRSGKKTTASDPFLKILANTHLGSNRYAHIVSVGSKAWLLGSSDGGVNLIGEIEDKDIINAMLLEESKKSSSSQASARFPDFLSILRKLGAQAETRTPTADDIRKRRERLKRL
ncbi:MAG: flagellar biosynthetic protein FliO [Treponema sp.]|nr:flagellar biosynthetic protein FliO [Treponema sp.]